MNKNIFDFKSNRLDLPQDECKLSTNMCSFQSAQSLQSFQSMMNVPIPSYKERTKYGYTDRSDFKWKKTKNDKKLVLRVSKGNADSNTLISIMLLIFLLPLPTALIFSQLLPSRHSGSSFIEIFLYNLVGVSIFSFLIRNVLKAIQPTWIVFQGDTLEISQSLIYTPNPRRVKRIPILDVDICMSDKALGHHKKPIMTFGPKDRYIYLKYKTQNNDFQDSSTSYYKLLTCNGSGIARPNAEYLDRLLCIQKAHLQNIPTDQLEHHGVEENIENSDFDDIILKKYGTKNTSEYLQLINTRLDAQRESLNAQKKLLNEWEIFENDKNINRFKDK
jgi:hypothetical protein